MVGGLKITWSDWGGKQEKCTPRAGTVFGFSQPQGYTLNLYTHLVSLGMG